MIKRLMTLAVLGLTFVTGRAYGMVPVHDYRYIPPNANSPITVVSNGARYSFRIAINVKKVEGGFVYADGYKYAQSSIKWKVCLYDGYKMPTSEEAFDLLPENYGQGKGGDRIFENPESGNNWLKSCLWQTPVDNQKYVVVVFGKRWPDSSGGGGGEYNPDWISDSVATMQEVIIYNTVIIKKDTLEPYGTGEEVVVESGETLDVKTYVQDAGGNPIRYSPVKVFWELMDSAPQNEGTGTVPESSTANPGETTGEVTAELTCSNKGGDDHIVRAKSKQDAETGNDSGKAVVLKIEILDPTSEEYVVDENPPKYIIIAKTIPAKTGLKVYWTWQDPSPANSGDAPDCYFQQTGSWNFTGGSNPYSETNSDGEVRVQFNLCNGPGDDGKAKGSSKSGGQGESDISAKITVVDLDIGFKNTKMSDTKKMEHLDYQKVGVVKLDTIVFKALLTPEWVSLQDEDYVWSGEASGEGPQISTQFNSAGNKSETLECLSTQKTAIAMVKDVPPPNQPTWVLLHLDDAIAVFNLSNEASQWASDNSEYLGGGLWNGRADAARHAYWNVLICVEKNISIAESATIAHERTNLEDNGPHNEIIMDLHNNEIGRGIFVGMGEDKSREVCQNAVVSALNAGNLKILDDFGNSDERGLLIPSNQ